MVELLGRIENDSVCSVTHEVWAAKVVWDAKATPGVANCPHREYWISYRGSSFMKCLVVEQDQCWAVLCWLTNKTQDINQIAATGVYNSRLPAYTSILFSSRIQHTGSILNCIDITWLAQVNASRSKTHPITYTTLYGPSVVASATCYCIMMLMPQM